MTWTTTPRFYIDRHDTVNYRLFLILYLYDVGHINDSVCYILLTERRGQDRIVVWFTTTYIISAYHHWSCDLESLSWRGVLDTTVYDKVCQW
jgi:hypothetical protein